MLLQIDDPRLPARFWTKVRLLNNGCWLWTAARTKGYATFQMKKGSVRAHRLSYETLVGPIPEGLESDHLCRNRACVNPAHIEPVTCQVNLSRGEHYERNKTHCLRGHLFDEVNTYRDKKTGGRYCRKCHCLRERRRKASLKKEVA